MNRKSYPSDLTDYEWQILEPLIPPVKPGGRPREHDIRDIINAINYLNRTGCQWRYLPHDFPPWETVYTYFGEWRDEGIWKRINDNLPEDLRECYKKEKEPSAAIIDSQTIKTVEKGGIKDMMAARKSKVVNAISSWIRLVY